MKKTIFFVLTLTVIFSFLRQLPAETRERVLYVKPEPPKSAQQISEEGAKEKRDHYIWLKKLMQEWISQNHSALNRLSWDSPSAVDIQFYSSYTSWQDGNGSVRITGLCQNTGSSTAISPLVVVEFFDSNQTSLGSEVTMVLGGSNVQMQTDEGILCPNALDPGEYGFFVVWPDDIPYSQAKYYSVSFTWYSGSLPAANARLDFDGTVHIANYQGKYKLHGYVKNSSSTYVTYSSAVCFAVFNKANTKILDVSGNYIGNSTYSSYGAAIYPLESEPFEVLFPFAPYNETSSTGLSAFLWYEAPYNPLNEKDPPFGSFDTPIHGSNVFSSIAVTGWALDDSGVSNVKIYREEGGKLIYIGDATLVEGARPDVAAAYPGYPNNTKAGWGYMMLTNFLPNGGNGTFTLHAIATDASGKTTTLGTKAIICENANAIRPFGAIDTPSQGGTASGTSFINWGWVLTPQSNYIPADGSTINVYVDGVDIGHPGYNNYRSDIADLFPGYANSNGAVGYFYLDTTAFENGVHTIQWTATDSAGNTDGIGSRYFSINNSGANSTMQTQMFRAQLAPLDIRKFSQLPEDYSPVRMKKGFEPDILPQDVIQDENGVNRIVIKELERIEVHLSDQFSNGNSYSGHLVVGSRLTALPVGSTLDAEKGIFYWQPGPGFLGHYHLVFVETAPNGTMMKKDIIVEILPKSTISEEYGR